MNNQVLDSSRNAGLTRRIKEVTVRAKSRSLNSWVLDLPCRQAGSNNKNVQGENILMAFRKQLKRQN